MEAIQGRTVIIRSEKCPDIISIVPKQKKSKRPTYASQLADYLARHSTMKAESPDPQTTRAEISMFMAECGRKGGKIGGKRRQETMTPKQRTTSARKAAQARWSKKPKTEQDV